MAAKLITMFRRIAGFASIPLLLVLCLPGVAAGQGSAPLVVASSPSGLDHPTGWQVIQQTAITKNGDWLVEEYPDGGLFEFPANGGPMVTLVPLYGLGSKNGYQNPLVLLDPGGNIYLGANWNNCLLEFPFDSTTNTWPGLSVLTPTNNSAALCPGDGSGTSPYIFAQYGIIGPPYYFQPWGIAVGTNDNLLVGAQNSGNFIFNLPVTGAWSNPKAGSGASMIITQMTKRPISIATDPEGNIYFVEDSNGLPGVYEIPAGTTGLTSDTGLTRVDPNLPDVTAVVTDATGNLYISDGQQGVYVVPNPSGTPQTADAYLLSSVPAVGEVAIDPARHILYLPTSQTQNNGQADVAKVTYSHAELGSANVGTAATLPATVSFAFNGSATPASFAIVEDGKTNPDFTIAGGTCSPGTAYAAGSSCTETITFTPGTVGSISAKLLMLDADNNVLSSIMLHGTGVGSSVQVAPALESTMGTGLMTPNQVAADALGNVYVADSGQGKVLMYPAGSGSSATPTNIGTGLTSPTGVAVDGAGDVFIADSGTGSVYEIPNGPSGLNAAGQMTLVGGLGGNLNLAVDSLGNLYVADPTKARVVRVSSIGGAGTVGIQSTTMLTAGFTTPSAVAVDSNNNLYVIDGANLFELTGGMGTPTTLMNNLSGATGLAVDPSGSIYISSGAGTERVPMVNGTLTPSAATAVASTVTGTSSVALDGDGNIYLTQSTGGSVTLVGTGGMILLPTPSTLTSSTDATFTVTNAGNAPLNVTNYTSSNSVDFTAADTTSGGCEAGSPVAVGDSCMVDVTFHPGPGEQGALVSQIGVVSNAFNSPTIVNATGTGLALADSLSSGSMGTAPQVVDTPISVTVAPKTDSSGTAPAPTGQVTVTFTSFNVVPINGVPTITPVTSHATANLVDGKASFDLAPVLAGSQNIIVNYSGDRVYSRSTTTVAASIAKSQISGLKMDQNPPPYLPFVLESGTVSGSIPYDGSQQYWQYSMPVTVNTAAGIPTGTLTFMDDSSTCPAGTSPTGQGAAICALANYKGVACPTSAGSAVVTIANDSSVGPTGAKGVFATGCLQMPQNTTYTPVISTHYVTEVYSGDANFLGFTSTQGTLFQALRSPEVLITSQPSSLSIPNGSSATATLTLTSLLGYGFAGKGGQLNDYNFPVSLACDNLPPHAVCTFSYPSTVSPAQPSAPNSVQIPCTGTTAAADNCTPGVVQVTIHTNVTVGTTTSMRAVAASISLASLFGFGMLGLFFRRRAFDKHRLLLIICVAMIGCALAVSITACNTTNLSPNAVLNTPSGTYNVTVTAQQVGYQCIPLAGPGANCTTTSGGPGVSVYGSQNQVSLPFYIPVTVQ